MSSDVSFSSFTGVVLSEDDGLALIEAGLWLVSCELVGSVKASWVELESESNTTSLSWLRSAKTRESTGYSASCMIAHREIISASGTL